MVVLKITDIRILESYNNQIDKVIPVFSIFRSDFENSLIWQITNSFEYCQSLFWDHFIFYCNNIYYAYQ